MTYTSENSAALPSVDPGASSPSSVTISPSSGGLPSGLVSSPFGDTYRGFGSSIWNENNIEREDWIRSEQSANNQYLRDMAAFRAESAFNASEAEKAWQRQLYLAQNQYQMTVEDMKASGLNPILAYQQGASSPSSPSAASASASSSGGRSSGGRRSPDLFVSVLGSLLNALVGGMQVGLGKAKLRLQKEMGSPVKNFNYYYGKRK